MVQLEAQIQYGHWEPTMRAVMWQNIRAGTERHSRVEEPKAFTEKKIKLQRVGGELTLKSKRSPMAWSTRWRVVDVASSE
jgi:hypothetical protein